jgi:RNase P/RNase MRP subunit p29
MGIAGKKLMYKEGQEIIYEGYTGRVYRVTETYRKNVISMKVTKQSRKKDAPRLKEIFLFQYKDGKLEPMRVVSE